MTSQSSSPSFSRKQWYVVSLLMLAYVFSFVDRQILYLLIEPIKADLEISDTQFSLLSGLAFSLFYVVMGVPIAFLSDRYSRVRIIAIGITFWSLATVACGLSKNFLHLFVARMGVGVGEAALTPAAYSILSDIFPREKLGRALGMYSMGAFLGGGLAFLVGGYVIDLMNNVPSIDLAILGKVQPWQLTFIVVGLPGILVALMIIAIIREPERKTEGQPIKPGVKDGITFIRTHRNTVTCHFLGFSFFAMCQYALLSWAPAMYMRKFGLTPMEVGYILGSILLVFNTAGSFCGGWLVDIVQKRGHADASLISSIIGISCTFIPAVGATLVDNLTLSIILIALALFFLSFQLSTSAAGIQVLAPNHLRAQITALFLLVTNLIGLGVGTTLVAILTDHFFKNPKSVGLSMAVIISVAAVLCFCLLSIGRKNFRASLLIQDSHRTVKSGQGLNAGKGT